MPMNRMIWLVLLALLVLLVPVRAQDVPELVPGEPVEGTVSGDPAVYTFYAWRDDVFSFHVEGLDGFDPVLTIQASGGETIAINDDYAYPAHTDSLLQAITIPRNGNYEVQISGFDEAGGGDFRLTMLPGYAELILHERFEQVRDWQADDTLEISGDDGALRVEAQGVQVGGGAYDPDSPSLDDFYAQVRVASISGRSGWSAGLMLRRQPNGDYYRFLVGSTGQWRFEAVEDGITRVIRDWTPHPAINAGDETFSLGVLANGDGFDMFYDDRVLGSVQDTAIADAGQIGVVIVTPNALDGDVTARFGDLIVTAPLLVNGDDVFPQQLVRGGRSQLIMELERRRVIPPGGQLILTVDESFVERSSPGVSVVSLGRGVRFTDVVIGATAVLQGGANGVSGCGLVLRRTDETDYTIAFVDNAGGLGVSERSDDTFNGGLFREGQPFDVAQSAELLVVVLSDDLHFFVDGQHMGTMNIDPVEGEMGAGVLNFDPQSATCRFTDTWVWRWN